MPLYRLTIHDEIKKEIPCWDISTKFIIYAESESRARLMAQEKSPGLEVSNGNLYVDFPFWTDVHKTKCEEIVLNDEIILANEFLNG
tara:strand:- start:122 stop:382 length:261 start_codon:yes stop_codon:yes gene_type:complete